MAKLITVYWRDIPAQVTAKAGRKTAKIQLTDRFQEAIDMAAMRAGKGSTDEYLEDWHRNKLIALMIWKQRSTRPRNSLKMNLIPQCYKFW